MEKISTGAVEMNEMSVTTLIIRQRGEQLFTTSVAAIKNKQKEQKK